LAAAILGGVDNIHMAPGQKVLYLGAASGTTVSHVADIVGPVSILSCVKMIVRCLFHRNQAGEFLQSEVAAWHSQVGR